MITELREKTVFPLLYIYVTIYLGQVISEQSSNIEIYLSEEKLYERVFFKQNELYASL